MNAVIVPYDQLEPETLNNVIEEFVTRDGTDYGAVEVSLETKISQVIKQLKSKKTVLVFDNQTESCTILKSDDPVLDDI
jgi:uncharacterized protein